MLVSFDQIIPNKVSERRYAWICYCTPITASMPKGYEGWYWMSVKDGTHGQLQGPFDTEREAYYTAKDSFGITAPMNYNDVVYWWDKRVDIATNLKATLDKWRAEKARAT